MAQIETELKEDPKAKIAAERQEYIQKRLAGHVGPPSPRAVTLEHPITSSETEAHACTSISGAVPTVEELRLQMKSERELFIGSQLSLGAVDTAC
jgi:hypothetical protein